MISLPVWRVSDLNRRTLYFADLAGVGVSAYLGLALRFDFLPPWEKVVNISAYVFACMLLAAVIFPALGVNRSPWRHVSSATLFRISLAVVVVITTTVFVFFLCNWAQFLPRSLPPLHAVLAIAMMTTMRLSARLRISLINANARPANVEAGDPARTFVKKHVLILGLNSAAEAYMSCVQGSAPAGGVRAPS